MKLLILSDIHGNLPALEAILRSESGPDAVAFCGDVVDYGPQPVECLRWLAVHATYRVRGNHDNAVALNVDCRCLGTFREYSLATRAWHRTLLSDADREFLRQTPIIKRFEWQGKQFHMAHASPRGDLFQYLNLGGWGDQIAGLTADFVLLGHTHIQGLRAFGGITVVNPGSVGLARDRRGEAHYAVYENGRMQLKRVPYDVRRTIAALHEGPLSKAVVEGLTEVLGAAST